MLENQGMRIEGMNKQGWLEFKKKVENTFKRFKSDNDKNIIEEENIVKIEEKNNKETMKASDDNIIVGKNDFENKILGLEIENFLNMSDLNIVKDFEDQLIFSIFMDDINKRLNGSDVQYLYKLCNFDKTTKSDINFFSKIKIENLDTSLVSVLVSTIFKTIKYNENEDYMSLITVKRLIEKLDLETLFHLIIKMIKDKSNFTIEKLEYYLTYFEYDKAIKFGKVKQFI